MESDLRSEMHIPDPSPPHPLPSHDAYALYLHLPLATVHLLVKTYLHHSVGTRTAVKHISPVHKCLDLEVDDLDHGNDLRGGNGGSPISYGYSKQDCATRPLRNGAQHLSSLYNPVRHRRLEPR